MAGLFAAIRNMECKFINFSQERGLFFVEKLNGNGDKIKRNNYFYYFYYHLFFSSIGTSLKGNLFSFFF